MNHDSFQSSTPHSILHPYFSLSKVKSLLLSHIGPNASPTLIKQSLPVVTYDITLISESILKNLQFNVHTYISNLKDISNPEKRNVSINKEKLLQDTILTPLIADYSLHILVEFMEKVKWILKNEKDQRMTFLWMWLDLHERNDLNWKKWKGRNIIEKLSELCLQHFLEMYLFKSNQVNIKEINQINQENNQKNSKINSSELILTINKVEIFEQFHCLEQWDTEILNKLFNSIVQCDMERSLAEFLRDKFMLWAERSLNNHRDFMYSTSRLSHEIKKNDIFLFSDFMKHYGKLLIKPIGNAPVTDTDVIEGYFISNGKAVDSMPTLLRGKFRSIILIDASESSSESHNSSDSDDDNSSSMQFTIKVKSREMLQELQMKKIQKIDSFIQLLLNNNIRLILVKDHPFDNQCLLRMAKENIVCIQHISSEEIQMICQFHNIETISMFGLNLNHPFVFFPPEEISPSSYLNLSMYKHRSLGRGYSISQLVPYEENDRFSTLLICAPAQSIATNYSEVLFKFLSNIIYDESFFQKLKSLKDNSKFKDINPNALYIIPGSGFPERELASIFSRLYQRFSIPIDFLEEIGSDDQLSFFSAISESFQRLGIQFPKLKSYNTLNTQIHLIENILYHL